MAMSNVPLGKNPLGQHNGPGNPLEELREIRSMMERSSRFISLSGLSGVFAGVFALIGAGVAYWYLDMSFYQARNLHFREPDIFAFFFADALGVLIPSLVVAVYLTTRQAKKRGQKIWDATSRRLLISVAIPLMTGGVFILALLQWAPVLAAPATLIFYGLALINASKFTLDDIRYLGYCEIALGLMSAFLTGYSLLFWAIGFGVLHIVYGVVMYRKYER
jgi:hypothetical protein